MKIRILVADDHTLVRQGIGKLLNSEQDMEVIGDAANAAEAVEQAVRLRADVVLMDVAMPGISSFEATRQIKKDSPSSRVLFLSMYDDEDYLGEAMQCGASGYVLKDTPAPQLVAAVRDVARGGTFLSARMLEQLVDDFRARSKGETRVPRFGTLTPRERDVLKFLAEGQSVKEIAGELGLSVKTIEAHKFNLMRKLGIHNKAQLVHYAIQKKIIKLKGPDSPEAAEVA
jgi:DNA-binding NarL/FixJ family response regulator